MIQASPILALAAEGEGGLLTPDGSILVIFVLFIALVPTLNALVVRPIVRVLNERERLTGGADTDVRAMLGTIDQNLGAYEDGVRDARGAGYKVLEERRVRALAERQSAIERARADAEGRVAAARAEIAEEAGAARTRLEADARDIAREISSSVLGRAVGGGGTR